MTHGKKRFKDKINGSKNERNKMNKTYSSSKGRVAHGEREKERKNSGNKSSKKMIIINNKGQQHQDKQRFYEKQKYEKDNRGKSNHNRSESKGNGKSNKSYKSDKSSNRRSSDNYNKRGKSDNSDKNNKIRKIKGGFNRVYDGLNLFEVRKKGKILIYTVNLDEGHQVYGENLMRVRTESLSEGSMNSSHKVDDSSVNELNRFEKKGFVELRNWIPNKSKLGAAIVLGLKNIGLFKGARVLYLGSASGTTLSHVSDLVESEGVVFGVDVSPFVLKKLYFLAMRRNNIIPILDDAFHPERYKYIVNKVDFLFEDVAHREQVKIFLTNARMFLKKGGIGMIAVKSRSIDVTVNPNKIYNNVRSELEKSCKILEFLRLDKYEKDHGFFVCKF
ncbi:MAG: fibrillarin-like rRNA/tRNA 2'-O-methyltransferase [Nitrospiraceae bacterium]|nr:fibrillarin-like rRNA/tRNA 2'-O-methyltransferase [Nitrospiraceae bacterium]